MPCGDEGRKGRFRSRPSYVARRWILRNRQYPDHKLSHAGCCTLDRSRNQSYKNICSQLIGRPMSWSNACFMNVNFGQCNAVFAAGAKCPQRPDCSAAQAKVPPYLNVGYVKIHTLLMTNRSPRRRRPTSTIFLAIYRPTHPPFACQACKWANRQNGTGRG